MNESTLPIYFAPLEGVTDGIFRRTHFEFFGGVSKYYIPFISPTQHLAFTSREQRSVSPAENAGLPVVPQVLAGRASHFAGTAKLLFDLGYSEVNLNLGCPSGTVTAKHKGSGLLRDLNELRAFLDEVFTSISGGSVSVKTRIGFESADEWDAIWAVLRDYPFMECIVHPRTRSQFYKGSPCTDAFARTAEARFPCAYNGDLNTLSDCRAIAERFPHTSALMLGRGLVANPALARQWQGGKGLSKLELKAFCDALLARYEAQWPHKAVLGHMQETMRYILCCFDEPKREQRALRKVRTVEEYQGVIDRLFAECELRAEPCFALDRMSL